MVEGGGMRGWRGWRWWAAERAGDREWAKRARAKRARATGEVKSKVLWRRRRGWLQWIWMVW